ncbi:hypothetical protein SAMN05444166_0239 [Singulisphaera sp. GP187]|uniref:hypothetical protein n=1 Tax=Singulisphaera sp. GP187 TaxID=1882752 RepID=UPI00092681F4|nr:hypothetical protein [Singulisphaera sp. GP187]SIN70156.1 hypothetical protein SAMN05444166_0239 [Singulisphaera sp. GP187]
MARKRYDLAFHIDSSRAVDAGKRVVRILENAEAAAKRAGTAMEAAYNRAATAANHAATAMANAANRMPVGGGVGGGSGSGGRRGGGGGGANSAEDRYLKADYDRRVRYEARKQQMADNAASAAARQATAQADQLSAIEDRFAQRDYTRRGVYERRQVAQKERTNRQLSAIEDRYLRDEYRKRVAYQAQVQRASERAAAATAARNERILMSGVAVASTAALAGLRVLHETYDKIHADAERAAEASFANRRNLLTESVLKGAERTTNKELLESFRFRAETGLGEFDATEFTRQYLGSVPIARQKGNITPQVEADLMKQAGIMAARQGGSASTRGELAGLLGQFGKVDSAAAGLSQLEAIRIALMEGRGDDTPLTKQLLASAGAMVSQGGIVGSLPEQAALIGVTSLSGGPGRAGTRAEQLSRALRGGIGDSGTRGNYLRGLKVEENDNLETLLDKIVPDLRNARGQGRNLDTYLKENKFGNQAERRALLEVEQVYDQLKERFKAAREAGANAEPANQRFLASPEGRAAVGDALNKAAEQTRGIRGERMAAYMREAAASPEFQMSENSPGASIGDRIAGYLSGEFSDPVQYGRTTRLQGIAGRIQRQRALDVGVSEEQLTDARHKSYRAGGDFMEENFNLVDQLISQKGGNLSANITPVMDRLAKALEENNRLVKENNARMGPPPPIAAAAPRQLGPRP